jgi:hypothetical protein
MDTLRQEATHRLQAGVLREGSFPFSPLRAPTGYFGVQAGTMSRRRSKPQRVSRNDAIMRTSLAGLAAAAVP